MVVPYTKPHLNFSQQVALLQSRGMSFEDAQTAESVLSSVGYYHISAYWFPFREIDPTTNTALDDFIQGVSFEGVRGLMQFDSCLRGILFEMLTDIELWLRCGIAYETGKRNPTGYHSDSCIDLIYLPGGNKEYIRNKWLAKLNQQIHDSKETFIAHFQSKYQPPMPVWVCCEVWDFGMSSNLFNMLSRPYKNALAARLGIRSTALLATWFHAMNVVRNICAHNARLWNRRISSRPQFPDAQNVPVLSFLSQKGYAPESLAAIIFITVWLHRQIMPGSTKHQELKAHLLSLTTITLPGLNHSMMGFQPDWEAETVWGSPAATRPRKDKRPVRAFNTSILNKWHFRRR